MTVIVIVYNRHYYNYNHNIIIIINIVIIISPGSVIMYFVLSETFLCNIIII